MDSRFRGNDEGPKAILTSANDITAMQRGVAQGSRDR